MCTKPAHMDGNCGSLVSWPETDTRITQLNGRAAAYDAGDMGSTPIVIPNETESNTVQIDQASLC